MPASTARICFRLACSSPSIATIPSRCQVFPPCGRLFIPPSLLPHLPLPALPKDLHTSLFIHTRKTHLPQYSYHLRPRSLRDVLCRVALGSVLCSSDHACCLTRSSALLLLQRMRSSTTLTQTVGPPLLLHPPPPPPHFTRFPRLPRILDPAASRAAAAPWVSYSTRSRSIAMLFLASCSGSRDDLRCHAAFPQSGRWSR